MLPYAIMFLPVKETNRNKEIHPRAVVKSLFFLGEDPVIYPRDVVWQHSVALRDSSS